MRRFCIAQRSVLTALLIGAAAASVLCGVGVSDKSIAAETNAAEAGADIPLIPFKELAHQFLIAIASREYDRAFDLVNKNDIKAAVRFRGGDEKSLLAEKKRIFEAQFTAHTNEISQALKGGALYSAVRHDDGNVTVWLPFKTGQIAVQLIQPARGKLAIASFSLGDGPVMR
jgi:hypothetical protein